MHLIALSTKLGRPTFGPHAEIEVYEAWRTSFRGVAKKIARRLPDAVVSRLGSRPIPPG